MPIYDTFTKRKKRAAAQGSPLPRDVPIPHALRVQIVYILKDALGLYRTVHRYDFSGAPPANERWRFIFGVITRERGVFALAGRDRDDPMSQCVDLMLTGETEDVLEVTEVSFRVIDRVMREMHPYDIEREGLTQDADDAIAELNARFQEHDVPYRFEAGQIIHAHSDLLHQEATEPAITLLRDARFAGPLDEFLRAHAHFRRGEIKDANVDALNAFESTLKSICDARKWKHPKGATAKQLVQVVLDEELIPRSLQAQFEHLLKTLETGIPTIRNKMGGHGQGARLAHVEDHIGAYALHLLGATIVLLIEAHKAEK